MWGALRAMTCCSGYFSVCLVPASENLFPLEWWRYKRRVVNVIWFDAECYAVVVWLPSQGNVMHFFLVVFICLILTVRCCTYMCALVCCFIFRTSRSVWGVFGWVGKLLLVELKPYILLRKGDRIWSLRHERASQVFAPGSTADGWHDTFGGFGKRCGWCL